METKIPQSFVKWVGGKRSLLDEIISRFPEEFNTYYEPFVGGGAVYFAIANKIKKAVLADSNLQLVLAYKVIQSDPEKLILKLKQHAKRHSKEYYYKVRSKEDDDAINTVARFLYLNKTCYNGLYRVNKSGKFNAPMGKYKNPNIIQEDNILTCHSVLKNASIRVGDFSKLKPKKDDFVYFDPPYHPTDNVSFTQYTEQNFTEKDQVRLRDFIVELHRRGVKIMLSNSKTKFIEDLYKTPYLIKHIVKAPRFVNCKSDQRGKVEELLITNYETRHKSKLYRGSIRASNRWHYSTATGMN